jgi:hypothetical protein
VDCDWYVDTRIFTFGIGAEASKSLVNGMAHYGRGRVWLSLLFKDLLFFIYYLLFFILFSIFNFYLFYLFIYLFIIFIYLFLFFIILFLFFAIPYIYWFGVVFANSCRRNSWSQVSEWKAKW